MTEWSLDLGAMSKAEAIARAEAQLRELEAAQADEIAADIIATSDGTDVQVALDNLAAALDETGARWQAARTRARALIAREWDRLRDL